MSAPKYGYPQPAWARVARNRSFLGGVKSRIPENTRSKSQIFYLTLTIQLNHFLHRTPIFGILIHVC